jgi:endoglucanase
VRWWGHTEAAAPYTVDEAWLARVGEVVAGAWARGLAVTLTMHHADPVYDDPAGSSAWLTPVWRQLAARFAGARDPLAFELLNEPRAPMTAADWNALLPEVLRAVREVDAGREVIVGGAAASSVAGLRQLELPPDERLLATVHYYEPFRFTHQGASWEPGSAAWLGTLWGTPADHAAVTADLEEAAAWVRRHGVPLLVGEFGAIAAADHASRIRWTSWVRRELERLGLPWAYWDFATDFGAYDLERRAWREDVRGALLGA